MRKVFVFAGCWIGCCGLFVNCSKSSSSSSSTVPAHTAAASHALSSDAATSTATATVTSTATRTAPATSTSVNTNTATAAPVLNGNLAIIQFSQHLGTNATFLTTRLNEFGGVLPESMIGTTLWKCPANSVLVGMRSVYANNDREYQLQCGFLEDGAGRPIQTKNCNTSSASTANVDFVLNCPTGTFPAGLESAKTATDRQFQFDCCELVTADNKQLAIPFVDSGNGLGPQPACDPPMAGLQASLYGLIPNLEVNVAGDATNPVSFTCPVNATNNETNKLLTGFNTEYFSDEQDRRWGFQCCQAGFPGTSTLTSTSTGSGG